MQQSTTGSLQLVGHPRVFHIVCQVPLITRKWWVNCHRWPGHKPSLNPVLAEKVARVLGMVCPKQWDWKLVLQHLVVRRKISEASLRPHFFSSRIKQWSVLAWQSSRCTGDNFHNVFDAQSACKPCFSENCTSTIQTLDFKRRLQVAYWPVDRCLMIFVRSIRGSIFCGKNHWNQGSSVCSVSHSPQPRFGYFRKDPGTWSFLRDSGGVRHLRKHFAIEVENMTKSCQIWETGWYQSLKI